MSVALIIAWFVVNILLTIAVDCSSIADLQRLECCEPKNLAARWWFHFRGGHNKLHLKLPKARGFNWKRFVMTSTVALPVFLVLLAYDGIEWLDKKVR